MAMYSKVSYWNHRYKQSVNKPPYEWYLGYHSLRHLLNPIHFAAQSAVFGKIYEGALLAPSSMAPSSFPSRENCRVLNLGCGNSAFGEQMQRDGWTGSIVNVDFSSVLIDHMAAKYDDSFYQTLAASPPGPRPQPMEFICADITAPLPFSDHTFDLIVCKGALDAVLCGAGFRAAAQRLVREVHRLLAPGHGVFFLVTSGSPDNRVEFLEHRTRLDHYWESVFFHIVATHAAPHRVDGDQWVNTYVYTCRRGPDVEDRLDDDAVAGAPTAVPRPSDTPREDQENRVLV